MKLFTKNTLILFFSISTICLFACEIKSKKTNLGGNPICYKNAKNVDEKSSSKSILVTQEPTDSSNILSDSLLKIRLLGKFNPESDSDFILVSHKYCNKNIYLQKETYKSFKAMHNAAQQDGITLKILSGTRNFHSQKGIWERKWTGKTRLSDGTYASDISDLKNRALKILLYSSMPSTSRHHWGTDVDLNNLNNNYFEKGQGLKEYKWLTQNAAKFGFCQVYSDKQTENRSGYEMEKWHWSYLPIAKYYTKKYSKLIGYEAIVGFKGSSLAKKIEAIKKYVEGISSSCQ